MDVLTHTSSSQQLRKIKKPLIERRRRERINDCLNQLKSLVLEANNKDESRYSKMEKADILEMTVSHLRALHRYRRDLHMSAAATGPVSSSDGRAGKYAVEMAATGNESTAVDANDRYIDGFQQCATEVGRYLSAIAMATNGDVTNDDGMDEGHCVKIGLQLMRHLASISSDPKSAKGSQRVSATNRRFQRQTFDGEILQPVLTTQSSSSSSYDSDEGVDLSSSLSSSPQSTLHRWTDSAPTKSAVQHYLGNASPEVEMPAPVDLRSTPPRASGWRLAAATESWGVLSAVPLKSEISTSPPPNCCLNSGDLGHVERSQTCNGFSKVHLPLDGISASPSDSGVRSSVCLTVGMAPMHANLSENAVRIGFPFNCEPLERPHADELPIQRLVRLADSAVSTHQFESENLKLSEFAALSVPSGYPNTVNKSGAVHAMSGVWRPW